MGEGSEAILKLTLALSRGDGWVGPLKRTGVGAEIARVELQSVVDVGSEPPVAAGIVDADPWSGIDHGKLWPGTYRAKTLLLVLLAACCWLIAGPWPALAVVAVVIPWNEWSGRWHRRHGRAHPLVCADQVLAVGVSLIAPAVALGSLASVMSCAPLGVLASGRRVAQRFTVGAIALLAIGAAVRQDWSTVVFSAPLLGCTIAAQRFVDYVLAKQRSSVSRFEDLLDGLQAAVVEVDLSDRRITYLNRQAGLLLANEPDSLSALVERVHPDDRVGLQAALDRVIWLPAEPMSVDVRTIAGSEVRHLAARATVSRTEDRSRLRLVLIDVSERKHIELELEHRATHDALTELPNRVLIRARMDSSINESTSPDGATAPRPDHQSERRSAPASQRHAVLVLDLDSFKDINDGLGHHHGDLLLVEIADRLRRVVRPCDTVARLGGDEFAVWLDGCDDAGARDIASRARAAVAAPYSAEGVLLYPEVSIGIACFPADADTTPDLLRLADMAMYRAKRTGTGYAMYASELDGSGPSRFALQAELREAIRNGALRPFFQPLVDGATGRIISCEALVRWHHPERGILTPAEFWPVVQSAGLSSAVAATMLRAVFGHLRGWHRDGIAVPVAVNLSTSDVCDEAVLDLIEHEITQGAYPPELLTVELTETELLAQTAVATAALKRLAALGVATAVDDFGTGYSSLVWLRDLPVTTVKIDRSFVGNLADERTNAIVRSTIALARDLGLNVVGEGVEDDATASALSSLGCERMQGYLFSRPVPPMAMEEKLRAGVARIVPVALLTGAGG
jgi:diguanylate cyclase (GGDEF)-like protein